MIVHCKHKPIRQAIVCQQLNGLVVRNFDSLSCSDNGVLSTTHSACSVLVSTDTKQTQLQGITFKFITTEEWGNEETLLQERFSKAKTIAGTQRLHCFVPVDTSTLQVQEYSASCDFCNRSCTSCGVTSQKYKRLCECYLRWSWWVACVTGTNPEMQEVTLSFLHPRGPGRSFLYPHKADMLTVHISDILTFVEPTTHPG